VMVVRFVPELEYAARVSAAPQYVVYCIYTVRLPSGKVNRRYKIRRSYCLFYAVNFAKFRLERTKNYFSLYACPRFHVKYSVTRL
jgi:hypothetical protein